MKVFVSGCSSEMGGFRNHVANQLARFGAQPIVQELFEISPDELPRLLRDKIKDSDAVICLVGNTFGYAPVGSSRSYTQMEHDIARELNKPTFIFLPTSGCKLPPAVPEAGPLRDLQQAYVSQLKSSNRLRYEFGDENHLRLLTVEAIRTLDPKFAGGRIANAVRADFPTPFALLYDELLARNESGHLRLMVAGSIRFLSLLALHDGALHRIVGRHNADTPEKIRSLRHPKLDDWRVLMRLACPEERTARFIPEFSGWERRNGATLEKLLTAHADLSDEERVWEFQDIATSLGQGMGALVDACDWLRNYVLLSVEDLAPGPGGLRVRIFRGLAPRTVALTLDAEPAPEPRRAALYLLSMDRRQALCLAPAFGTIAEGSERQVAGWTALANGPGTDAQLRYTTFDRRSAVDVPVDTAFQRIGAAWLGHDLAPLLFPAAPTDVSIRYTGKFLDDASWDALQKIVFPTGESRLVLAGRFRAKGSPLHRGLHADLYEVEYIETKEEPVAGLPGEPLVHVLRAEVASDPAIRGWFQTRVSCWYKTTCEGVLPLFHPDFAAGVSGGPPFLLTRKIAGAVSLEQMIRSHAHPDPALIRAALDLAFSACAAAHARGVLLLTLPLRHFLLGEDGRLQLTGFDAAIPFEAGQGFPREFAGYLRRFAREFSLNEGLAAPELDDEGGRLAESIDVFAIGALLQQLRGRPVLPRPATADGGDAGAEVWGSWRHDPLECFLFHCLARDPMCRFQSVGQCRRLYERFCGGPVPASPVTVALSDTVRMGRHPVTNFEYERFCRETRRMPPTWSLGTRHAGPFAPVVNVSVRDAASYCAWLTRRDAAGAIWRMPTDEEWTRVAGPALFPWGHAAPTMRHANWFGAFGGPTVVGSHPAGRSESGCEDLIGNVWEWCDDPVEEEPRRVVRGGSYASPAADLTAPSRQSRHFGGRFVDVGFRVLATDNNSGDTSWKNGT